MAAASVTGFPSRGWQDVVKQVADVLAGGDGPVGVALIDVDHFADRADEVAHLAEGRQYLVEALIDKLTEHVNVGDVTARVGDDDFLIVRSPLTSPAEVESLGLRLLDAFSTPIEIEDMTVPCSVSVGVVTSCTGDRPKDLLRYAQYALDDAKVLGRGRMIAFADEDREFVVEFND